MKEIVLQKIKEKHEASGGHNGYYLAMLIHELQSTYQEVRTAISEIYKDGNLYVCEGSKGNLIFYKSDKNEAK
jgi:hypothetical protein